MMNFIKKQIDAAIYGFVGPFAFAYIFPMFFKKLGIQFNFIFLEIPLLKNFGIFFLNLGGILALWSTIIMYKSKKASPSPFSLPKKVISTGPFKYVRHPMMWALHFVIIGQILVNNSLFIVIWFIIWLRFSILYIDKYEEPYLISIFGDEYLQYCINTPRWIPNFLRKPSK